MYATADYFIGGKQICLACNQPDKSKIRNYKRDIKMNDRGLLGRVIENQRKIKSKHSTLSLRVIRGLTLG